MIPFLTAQLIMPAATPADQRLENVRAAMERRSPIVFPQRADMQTTPPVPNVGPVDLPGGPLHEFVPTAPLPASQGARAWIATPTGLIVTGLVALGLGAGAVYLWRSRS